MAKCFFSKAAATAQVQTLRSLHTSAACWGTHRGTVKFFNAEKGFGFVADSEGRDYFVHYTAIQSDGFRSLADGEEVEFDLEVDERKGGHRCANVTGPEGRPVQGAPRRDARGGNDDFY